MTACFCTGACRELGYCPVNGCTENWHPYKWYFWPWTDADINTEPKPPTGWKCPLCGRANAPTRKECPCYKEATEDGR